ncbi:MAG: LacI family DNA-binding transcriptional regulator [Anaerolineae bacterium]|nr:LacI family DNA-binding transcriptional regulator [Anaerolineae bacterium]
MNYGLEDIAKLAGVSKSTVSRVINNQPNVRERTRQRVLDAIRAIDYRPNNAARALVTRQTRVLSLVVPIALAETFTDPYFPALIQGITLAANERNYAIMLWVGQSSEEEEERYCERILSNGLFDGVIMASAVDSDPLLRRIVPSQYPHVLVGPPQQDVQLCVDVDNRSAACEAVTHLVKLGFQRIGMVTGPLNTGSARDRFDGYRDALTNNGRAVDLALVVNGNYDEISGFSGMNTLIERRVDAVFCGSDMIALGVMRALLKAGLRIPEDVAVVGFDDMPFAATTNPPLTTVHQPIDLLGRTAAQLLISLIEGEPLPTNHVVLQAHLVVRSTCGAARIA